MPEIDPKTEINNLRRQLDVAMKTLAVYESENLEKDGYYTLKGFVKKQIDIVKAFDLGTEIKKSPKDDKYYDRVKAIGEGLKSMISDLKALKTELKLTQKDDEENESAGSFIEGFAETRN